MGVYDRGRPYKWDPNSNSGSKPPQKPGEYRIRDKSSGDVQYLGLTNNVDRRIKEHQRSGKISSDSFVEYKLTNDNPDWGAVRDHERDKINRFDPPLNQRKGGGGRPPISYGGDSGGSSEPQSGGLFGSIFGWFK